MGQGIVSESGADVLEVFDARLVWLGNVELARDVRRLLAGGSVESRDGVLEISWLPSAEQGLGRLTVRRPAALYLADLDIQAIAQAVVNGPADARGSFPCPDSWRSELDDETVEWELFNCVIHDLRTRSNAS